MERILITTAFKTHQSKYPATLKFLHSLPLRGHKRLQQEQATHQKANFLCQQNKKLQQLIKQQCLKRGQQCHGLGRWMARAPGTGARCVHSSWVQVPGGSSITSGWSGKGDESGELPACFSPPDSVFKGKENKPWKTTMLARTSVCSNFC